MSQSLIVTGMVLSAMPIGEFDKRVVLLTRELGEISAFARGARRPRSQLLAATGPMAFGTFELYEGRNSYTLARASIEAYFLEIAEDYDKVCLAAYFLEMAEYYGIENSDESQRLLLLYQTLRALASDKFSPRLLRIIYEIRTMGINGEYPDVFSCAACGRKEGLVYFHMGRRAVICSDCQSVEGGRPISASALYAFQFILSAPMKKLFSFRLTDPVEEEVWQLLREYQGRYLEHSFKAEAFLSSPGKG